MAQRVPHLPLYPRPRAVSVGREIRSEKFHPVALVRIQRLPAEAPHPEASVLVSSRKGCGVSESSQPAASLDQSGLSDRNTQADYGTRTPATEVVKEEVRRLS